MEMAKILKCEVSDCSYNVEQICHALAITVGDGVHPRCDTFFRSGVKGGDMSCIGGVGACRVSSCTYNNSLECRALEICVGYQGDEVDCLTFKAE